MSAFGKTISARRQALNLSLSELANRAGMAKGSVWDMERGNSDNPTVATICRLAVALDVDPAKLAAASIHDQSKKIKIEVTTTKRVKR